MLLFSDEESLRTRPEGEQVAGLLDLVKLMEYLGNAPTKKQVADMRRATKAAPDELYNDHRLFIDPRDRLMRDTGPTYVGRPLRRHSSLTDLVENGQTLREYLDGTEVGDVFKNDIGDIRVGIAQLPQNFLAGYTDPKRVSDPDTGQRRTLEDGFLVVGDNIAPESVGPTFEHEMQHAYQGLLGMPRGTNLDDMSSDQVQYLMDSGYLRPAQLARIDQAARDQGTSIPYMRYSAATGEAEARAAEAREYGRQGGYEVGRPRLEEYLWTHDGPELTRSMLFDIPPDVGAGFKTWWKNRWK